MPDVREYRLRWRREGCRERTKLYQRRAAAERYALLLQGRMAEYTGLDPDAFMCCPGCREDECGCRGVTNAEEWAARAANVPPLVEGPAIDERVVSEWVRVQPFGGKP